jgi:hypothetical protein
MHERKENLGWNCWFKCQIPTMGVREKCCIHVAVALSAEAVIVQLEPDVYIPPQT